MAMHKNMKKKGMARGGAMAKKKKMAKGGMTMKKKPGMAKGGKMKKGMARGGKMKKGYAKGGATGMTLSQMRSAAKAKGYKLTKM
tara:strand:- start:178 stop:432 length:255 start_codon:yes stop_codon:yes gene_type:complete